MNKILSDEIKAHLEANGNKISKEFIDNLVEHSDVVYTRPTPNVRVCVVTLYSGHICVGVAKVLDEANDDEAIGNSVALDNATDELWGVIGTIAKCIMSSTK
jgi:hypothetical protein